MTLIFIAPYQIRPPATKIKFLTWTYYT